MKSNERMKNERRTPMLARPLPSSPFPPGVDMRALIGWGAQGGPGGGGRILLSFRGTASMENVKTDLKVRINYS